VEEGDPAESGQVHNEEVLTQEMHHVDLGRQKKYGKLIYNTTSIRKTDNVSENRQQGR